MTAGNGNSQYEAGLIYFSDSATPAGAHLGIFVFRGTMTECIELYERLFVETKFVAGEAEFVCRLHIVDFRKEANFPLQR